MQASARRPLAATRGVPSPSKTQNQKPGITDWPEMDTLLAAYRLKAHGWTENAALAWMIQLCDEGVRSPQRLIGSLSDDQLTAKMRAFESKTVGEAAHRRRGDLMVIRQAPRWPWRTSTGGGHVE